MVKTPAAEPEDGASLADDACWFRSLTNADYITRDGTVHYQAIKGTAFRQSDGRPWAHELSGRLGQLVDDAVADGRAAVEATRTARANAGHPVPSKLKFVGIAAATASELRAATEVTYRLDVVYTPLLEDKAHSDFVTYGTLADEDLIPARYHLIRILRVIEPDDIRTRLSRCGVADIVPIR
jgi:hypothetical protein